MTNNCTATAPGQNLESWQKLALNLISSVERGRDVTIAIDLTESVGLNAEGRLRLTQIIQDSLQPGDTIYVVPFASQVNPLQLKVNPITLQSGIKFRGLPEDIEQILQRLPFQSEIDLGNTDIQNAELFIYRQLAQLNQCRLAERKVIKPQSVVWLTDAPLLTKPGITSDTWVETPGDSPFRSQDSQASQERQDWLQALPLVERSQNITTNDNRTYELSVVDIAPTVQEFCTPAPGGKETCLVTPYLGKLLWLPSLILVCLIVAGGFWGKYLISLNKRWKLKIVFESDDTKEEQICYLKNKQKIAIGDDNLNSIFCPGDQPRGYLQRKGNKLILVPHKAGLMFYREQEVTKVKAIESNNFRLNCPWANSNFDIVIKVIK